MISAVVLAAGLSSRMGQQNKLLLPFRDTTIIGNMVDVVLRSRVGETLVIVGHESDRVRAALGQRPVRVVENPDYAQGMGSSVQAGVRAVSPQATGIMICLTDLPLLEPEELDQLIAAFEQARRAQGASIIVPAHDGQRGNPVLFSARYREEVLNTRGPVAGCRGIVKRYPQEVLEVQMQQDHILRDMDTLDDYRLLVGSGN